MEKGQIRKLLAQKQKPPAAFGSHAGGGMQLREQENWVPCPHPVVCNSYVDSTCHKGGGNLAATTPVCQACFTPPHAAWIRPPPHLTHLHHMPCSGSGHCPALEAFPAPQLPFQMTGLFQEWVGGSLPPCHPHCCSSAQTWGLISDLSPWARRRHIRFRESQASGDLAGCDTVMIQ